MSRGVSPATTPSAIRMASFARWETRGSSEIRTRTGCRAATLVEREEAVGGVDDVRQHDEAAVGGLVGQRLAVIAIPVLIVVTAVVLVLTRPGISPI